MKITPTGREFIRTQGHALSTRTKTNIISATQSKNQVKPQSLTLKPKGATGKFPNGYKA